MDTRMLIIGVLVAVVALASTGYFFSVGQTTESDVTNQDTGATQDNTDDSGSAENLGVREIVTVETTRGGGASEHTVEITDSGFSPSDLTIAAGDTVTFVNGGGSSWPASDIHPTHTAYPGSGISKCGTGEAIFDSCRGLANGESFSFRFSETGTWTYHDHLRSSLRGAITVQ